ncbi:MAG TPA: cupin domain-containing protein [Polyangiaceae bacterium]|nr:cupin domain-containing protein [Polyangiaceae bacterium]
MAIQHALPGQVVDVKPFGDRIAREKTFVVFKSKDLEVLRLVLQAGHSVPEHSVSGEITVQCIEGSIDFTVGGQSHVLHAGQLLYVQGGAKHSVAALEDASVLVTIALRGT